MAEGMPGTPEQMWQLNRSLTEKVLDKAASDPQWKQLLLDNPDVALREANFPEHQRLEEMRQSARGSQEEGAEVRGQQRVVDHYDLSGSSIGPEPLHKYCHWTCYGSFFTLY